MKLNEKEFEELFQKLDKNACILLLSQKPIEKDNEVYFSNKVYTGESYGVKYLFWHGAGSSANLCNRRDLHFILEDLFSECNYYKVLTQEEYEKTLDRYFDAEFAKRQKELDKVNNEEE